MADVIFRRTLKLLLLMVLALTAACTAGPPVQEMSNARQVIRAARDAGAAETSSASLDEAERLLSRAEAQLQKGEYRAARRDANAARAKAAEALRVVQSQGTDRTG
jgi:hypothetical protein